jgi:aspartyl-tRNA(Asn)/glutamyl-tRNA(Gln) amidotransferase subunit C
VLASPTVSRITRKEVHDVAKLARLALSDAEVERLTADLDHILEYVETLRELDTEGIEPTAHAIPLETPMRADRAVPGIDPELAVANAPESIATAFAVPKVIEGEDES